MPKSAAAWPEQSRAACLECRLNKTRCRPGSAGKVLCHRCQQFGFECRYEQQHKRGRKPKSKLQNAVAAEELEDEGVQGQQQLGLGVLAHTSSTARDTLSPLTHNPTSARLRQRAWQTLTRSARMRGSTYTFVAAGNVELGGDHVSEQPSGSASAAALPNSTARSTSSETPTLRKLLRRVDQRFGGHGSTAAELPSLIEFSAPSDPRKAGIVSDAECVALVGYFDVHMLPWIAVLEPVTASAILAPSAAWSDGLLLSVIAYLAARFSQSPRQKALGAHARSLAVQAFAKVEKTYNVLLALDLLAVWKAPDDDFSDLYAGYSDHIAGMLAAAAEFLTADSSQTLRVQIFHYVQRSVYQLHCGPSSSSYTAAASSAAIEHAWPPLTTPLLAIEQLENAQRPSSDWFLCSDAESTAIQCKYKDLFLRQVRWGSMVSSCLTLLDAFAVDMQAWEVRWSRIGMAQRRTSDAAVHRMHWSGFQMLGKSVRLHITSIAFRRGLEAWRTAAMSSIAATNAAVSELVQQSYRLCIDSCIGLLNVVPQLRPGELMHMPDSIIILINHAALMAVYLLLAPAAVAESESLASSQRRHDSDTTMQPPGLWKGDEGSESMAQECTDAIKLARDALFVAASTCPEMESTCALSADHLNSLNEMLRDDGNHEQADISPTSNEVAIDTDGHALAHTLEGQIHGPDSHASAGWDWLQTFLDDATALPLFLNQ